MLFTWAKTIETIDAIVLLLLQMLKKHVTHEDKDTLENWYLLKDPSNTYDF